MTINLQPMKFSGTETVTGRGHLINVINDPCNYCVMVPSRILVSHYGDFQLATSKSVFGDVIYFYFNPSL